MTQNDDRLDRNGDSLEGRLLRAGDMDGPSPRAVQKALLAATAGLGTAGAASTAAAGGAILKGSLLKWLGLGALGVAALFLGRELVSSISRVPTLGMGARPLQSSVEGVVERIPKPSATNAESSESEPTVPEPAPTPRSAVVQPPSPSSATTPAPARDTLRDELALLDDARHAVSAHDAARAMSLIGQYQKEFPKGRLYPELTVIRVQALLLQGRRAEAESLARKFLAASPKSPSAKRLRSLTGIAE